jgi:hypothetical protein
MEDTQSHPNYHRQFVGSAVVAGVSYGGRSTILQLRTFAGENISYVVSAIPDSAGEEDACRRDSFRPISVKIQDGGDRCSVIALTPNGPQCSSVSLGAALALERTGVRTVVDGGMQIRVPCGRNQGTRQGAR